MHCPVIKSLSDEAKNNTVPTKSSVSERLRKPFYLWFKQIVPHCTDRIASVVVSPGATAFKQILYAPNSFAIARVGDTTPPLKDT